MPVNHSVKIATHHAPDTQDYSNRVKNRAKNRIHIIKGQLDGLLKMINEDKYCIDLLNQSLAVQNSLKSLDALLFERHLKIHVTDQFPHEKNKAVAELFKLFKRIHQ